MIPSIQSAVEEAVAIAKSVLANTSQKAHFATWADWLDDLLDPTDPGKNQKGWDKAFELPEQRPHTS